MKKSKIGKCVFCGKRKKLTREHIPPKNLYSPPRPSNLIVVPCCEKCNNQFSNDDEYFRTVLTMRYDTYEHPNVTKNWERVRRSFKNPQQKGMKKSIFKTFQDVDLYTTSGIYLGKSAKYNIDIDRVKRVVEKITRGLIYHEYGIILPATYEVDAFVLEMIKINDEVLNFISMIKSGQTKTIGNKVFTYWIRQTDEDINTIISLILFYDKVPFIGMSIKK